MNSIRDSYYDVVVCGTGITESLLACLLSRKGFHVFFLDRNPYYGASNREYNLKEFYEEFLNTPNPLECLGNSRYWNIDTIPQTLDYYGDLTKLLQFTKVDEYLEFNTFQQGPFLYRLNKPIEQIPYTQEHIQQSQLILNQDKQKWQELLNIITNTDCNMEQKFGEFISQFNFQGETLEIISEIIGFSNIDQLLQMPANLIIQKLSKLKMQGQQIYPQYGLQSIIEGSSRSVAINGGTVMLNVQDLELLKISDVQGYRQLSFCLNQQKQIINFKYLISEPSYAQQLQLKNKIKSVCKVIRCILICATQDNLASQQIIIPGSQFGKQNNIYVTKIGAQFNVCLPGYMLCYITTKLETANFEQEIQPIISMYDHIVKVVFLQEQHEANNQENDNIYFTNSCNEEFYLDNIFTQIKEIYQKITNEQLKL